MFEGYEQIKCFMYIKFLTTLKTSSKKGVCHTVDNYRFTVKITNLYSQLVKRNETLIWQEVQNHKLLPVEIIQYMMFLKANRQNRKQHCVHSEDMWHIKTRAVPLKSIALSALEASVVSRHSFS